MLDINDTKMRYEDNPNNKNCATCTCEPLDRGYGTTIGSSLKRVLMSSVEGAAVIAVKAAGVKKMTDSLDGVQEDFQEVVLNLRELSIKPVEAPVKAYIKVKADSERIVTAADITCEQELEIVNPEHQIATLAAGKSLDIELQIAGGCGYVAAEKNTLAEKGMIPMDAVYSPVKRVEYKVQNTRVGNTTDYDRLILEIETDGTISPADALNCAAGLMIDAINPLWQLAEAEIEEPNPELNNIIYNDSDEPEEAAPAPRADILDHPIEDLELNARPANCMRRAQILTIGDLVERTDEEVRNLRNLGSKSYGEIIAKLAERGLSLKQSEQI